MKKLPKKPIIIYIYIYVTSLYLNKKIPIYKMK